VSEHHLQIAHEGPVVEGVSSKRVAKMVRRKATKVTAVRRRSNGSLDIGFMATPAHKFVSAGITTNAIGGEEPGPSLGMGRVGIFLGQKSWQRNGNTVRKILCGCGLSQGELSFQGRGETLGEHHHPTLVAFGLMDVKMAAFEVQVFNS